MKKLICDLDDVICNNNIINLANKFLNTNYTFEDVAEGYDFSKLVPDKQKLKQLYEYVITNNIYKNATLKNGCYEVLQELQEKHCYEIYICSAFVVKGFDYLSGCLTKDKYDFIRSALPFINPNNIIFTNAKGIVMGDVIIDDRMKNLDGNYKTKLLFDCWYNRKHSEQELTTQNIQRVCSWQDIKYILIQNNMF